MLHLPNKTAHESSIADKSREIRSRPDGGVLRKLVQGARLAPSADNNQPWRFSPRGDGLEVQLVEQRRIKSDPEGILDKASLGMALENLRLAALEEGLSLIVEYEGGSGLSDPLVARVNFAPSVGKSELFHYLFLRRTNRESYRTCLLPTSISNELQAAASGNNAKISEVHDRGTLLKAAASLAVCDEIRFRYASFHQELYSTIRWSRDDSAKSGDGIWIDALSLPLGGSILLKALRRWNVCAAAMSFGANAALRMVSRKQIASSGALYMVTSEDRSDRSLIEAGMLCERLWLILSKHGLSVQPLGAFPVFNDLALDERAMLADSHRQRILRVREEVFESFHCCGSEVPVLLFRAGYAAKQSPRNLFRRTMIEVAPELLPERSKEKFDYDTAFSRNIGIVRRGEQELLKQTKVAIPGLGGVGGIHLATLARMGVGGFHLADFDRFDLANFNRQFGAFVSTLGESKTEVMSKIVRDINPEISLGVWKEGISEDNVEEFLRGTQLVIDSLDAYEIDVRRLVFMKARLMGIPVITAGPIGLSCAMLVFMPDSMSFDDYFCIEDGMSQQEKFTRFILGLIPHLRPFKYLITDEINSAERRGPSSAAAVTLCSGFAAVEALKVLLNKVEVRATPYCHYYDPYLMRFKCGYLRWGNRGPLQKMKYEIVKRKVSR